MGTKTKPNPLIVVRPIKESALLKRKNDLVVVNLVTGSGIIILNRVKEEMVELNPQLQQCQQVEQPRLVTYLVLVELSTKIGCMLFRLTRIWNILLM